MASLTRYQDTLDCRHSSQWLANNFLMPRQTNAAGTSDAAQCSTMVSPADLVPRTTLCASRVNVAPYKRWVPQRQHDEAWKHPVITKSRCHAILILFMHAISKTACNKLGKSRGTVQINNKKKVHSQPSLKHSAHRLHKNHVDDVLLRRCHSSFCHGKKNSSP